MSTKMTDLEMEALKIKKLAIEIKKGKRGGNYGKSKLRPYKVEILTLKDTLNLSFGEIRLWLKVERGVNVSRSQVSNFYYKCKKDENGETIT